MQSHMSRSQVRIFGALSALGNESREILGQLAPLFFPVLVNLKNSGKNELNVVEVADEFSKAYKKNCTSDVVQHFVKYFEQYGWIILKVKKRNEEENIYSYTLPEETIIDGVESSAETDLNRLSEEFKNFSKQFKTIIQLPDDLEFYKRLLVDWLLVSESFNKNQLKLQFSSVEENFKRVEILPKTSDEFWLDYRFQFLCAKFVKNLCESNHENSQIVIKLASLALLTEVIQDFIKPTTLIDATNLKVFLDSRVAMEYLNVSGKVANENIKLILNQLESFGAKICMFDRTVGEVQIAIRSVLKNTRPYGPTAKAITYRDIDKSTVQDTLNDLLEIIKNSGITVLKANDIVTPELEKIFNVKLNSQLYDELDFHENSAARAHDAWATSLTMAQIYKHQSQDIFNSEAIFLTRNILLARKVQSFYVKKGILMPFNVGPVMLQSALATFLWLRTGKIGEVSKISKNYILSNCEMIMEIRPNFIKHVNKTIELIEDSESREHYRKMLESDRTLQILNNLTLNSEELISPSTLGTFEQNVESVIDEEIQENSALKNEINEIEKVDLGIIEKLGERVNESLKKSKSKLKISSMVFIAIVGILIIILGRSFSIPFWSFNIDIIVIVITLVIELVLHVIQSKPKKDVAKKKFYETAKNEGLIPKLKKYNVDWNENGFKFDEISK